MRAHLGWLVRTVVAPVLLGAVVVSVGTLGYLLFWPRVYWAAGGRAGQFPPFLATAALVGALAGAAAGLCIAAERVANGGAARDRRLRRPPRRLGRETRRPPGRLRLPAGPARVAP